MVNESLKKFLLILKQWANHFPYDFREVKMVVALDMVRDKCIYLDESITGEFEDIAKYLASQVKSLKKIASLKKINNENYFSAIRLII